MLAFGPDGFLYIGLGDGGSGGDPHDNGQSLDTKLGKILRIDVDAYPNAAGRQPSTGGDPDIWDLGLRNPWRFSFDRATGDLYIGDVGQDAFEEIDVEPRGTGGQQLRLEHHRGPALLRSRDRLRPDRPHPARSPSTSHADGGCAVIGGYVYRGSAIPDLDGRYFYGDFCSNRIWSFVGNGGQVTSTLELTERPRSRRTRWRVSPRSGKTRTPSSTSSTARVASSCAWIRSKRGALCDAQARGSPCPS